MAPKGKMPPALLAHFKSRVEGDAKKSSSTNEEKKEGADKNPFSSFKEKKESNKKEPVISDKEKKENDNKKRKEAVKKARIRMEESSRSRQRVKQEKTGQKGTQKS
jgi:hypothetical protein